MADDRIDRLERELARMRLELEEAKRERGERGGRDDEGRESGDRRGAAPERAAQEAEPGHGPAPARRPPAAPPAEPLRWNAVPDDAPAGPAPAAARGPGAPRPADQAAPGRAHGRGDLETQLGGRILAIIGAVVFVIGVVFFLKLAFDRGWIAPAARIVLGIVGGLAIWATGIVLDRMRGMPLYGQLLSAVGAVTAYVTMWLAYQLPSFREITRLSLEADAVLLGLIAVLVAGDAVWRRAQPLAGMALGLVFTTAMISHAWAPFSVFYAVVLVTLVVLAAAYRQWPAVTLGAVPVGFGILAVHLGLDVSPQVVLAGTGILLAVFLVAGMFRMRGELPWELQTAAQALALLASWGLGLWALYDIGIRETVGHGPLTGGLAALGLGMAAIPVLPRESRIAWAAAGGVMAVAWPPIQFDGVLVGYAWAALAMAMAAVAAFSRNRILDGVAGGMAFVLMIRLLAVETPALARGETGVVTALGLYALALGAYLIGWIAPVVTNARDMTLARSMLAGAGATPLLFTAASLDGPMITIAWAAVFLTFLGIGFATRQRDLRMAGLVLVFPVLVRLLFVDMAGVDVVLRVVAFLVVGGILLFVAFLYARSLRGPMPVSRPRP